ncbi:MAG: phosphomannomutase/phosphoglucomutase [Methylococcales bacterium]
MERIFTLFAAVAVLMILCVGGGVYWLSSSQIEQSKQQTMQATAEGVATNLSGRIALLQELVTTLAQSPPVIAAFNSADPTKLQETAKQLEQYIPGALKIHLVLPVSQDQANAVSPAMGYADQEMVRESFINQQLPAVHEQSTTQHLAIAAKSTENNTTIGVLLASISINPFNQSIQNLTLNEGYIGLMQGTLALQERGEPTLKDLATKQINVNNSNWDIRYASAPALDSALQSLFAGLIVSVALLAALLFFQAYRYFENLLIRDRSAVITATKDLLNHRLHDNYPVNFNEMRFIIDALTELNRATKKSPLPAEQSAPYQFSEESEGLSITAALEMAENTSSVVENDDDTLAPSLVNLFPSTTQDILDTIFKASNIRGIVNKNLTKELLYDIGRALGSELNSQNIKKIVLGYDGRHSSPSFAEAFAKGIIATGMNVLDIGQVPAPLVYFAALQTEEATGAMITGGHNPRTINGLKLLIKGEPASEQQVQAIKKRIATENYALYTSGSIEKNHRYNNDYLNKISKDIQLINPLKVVLDCGNGVTSLIAPALFKTLGCEVIELFCEINGDFPNHLPDPSKPENLSDLMAAVHHYQADIGIAFSGDGDRLGVVDSAGKIIWPDKQILLFAKHILQAKPGARIIYDEKCSKLLAEQTTQYGGQPLLCKSGQSLMRLKLKETGALLAGEMNGRLMFSDRWSGLDDGLYAASRLLEILSADIHDSAAIFNALSVPIKKPEIATELQDG